MSTFRFIFASVATVVAPSLAGVVGSAAVAIAQPVDYGLMSRAQLEYLAQKHSSIANGPGAGYGDSPAATM